MNTSRRWMNLMRFSLNVAVSLQTIWIRSERTPFSNGGHSTTRNRSKLAQKGSAKPFMRKAYHTQQEGFCYLSYYPWIEEMDIEMQHGDVWELLPFATR